MTSLLFVGTITISPLSGVFYSFRRSAVSATQQQASLPLKSIKLAIKIIITVFFLFKFQKKTGFV